MIVDPPGAPRLPPPRPYGATAAVIRALRKELGLTQERFAGEAGVTVSTINRWEGGLARPSQACRLLIDLAAGRHHLRVVWPV